MELPGVPASRTAVNALRKAEAIRVVESQGYSVPPTWSAEEVKSYLKELLFPEARKTVQISGNKKQLQARCQEMGVEFALSDTNAKLMTRIRDATTQKEAPKGTDYVEFGKHGGMTYQQLKDRMPSYADWVVATAEEPGNEAHWKLRRLASWLQMTSEELEPPPSAAAGARTREEELACKVAELEAELIQTKRDQDEERFQEPARRKNRKEIMQVDRATPPQEPAPLAGLATAVTQVVALLADRLQRVEPTSAESDSSWAKSGLGVPR